MNKRTLRRLFFAAATMLSTQIASAQINNAANQDNLAGTYSGMPDATNLGNAVVRFGSGEIKAMVWDGGSPTFAWEFNRSTASIPIEGTNYGTVTDPDIVLNPASGGETALITYLLGDQVYYEVHEFDAGANMFNLIDGPTQVSNGAGPCHSPNVDINENGIAVIVYGQADPDPSGTIHRVYSRTTDLNGGATGLTPVYEYIRNFPSPTFKALNPDVAVFGDQISVVYIHDDNGVDKDVNIMQDNLNSVVIGGVSPYFSPTYQYLTPSASDDVGSPRIAGPVLGMALDDEDFQAVVQVNKNIIGLNRYAAISPNLTSAVLNATNGLNQCEVREPVVAYLHDQIIVAWNQKHCVQVGGKDTKEIFARKLSFGGVPSPSGYSVVNFDRTLA